jgi:hypothetical protein
MLTRSLTAFAMAARVRRCKVNTPQLFVVLEKGGQLWLDPKKKIAQEMAQWTPVYWVCPNI